MNKALWGTFLMFVSLPAWAVGGGSSIGPSLCHYADLVCQTNIESVLDRTTVCVFAKYKRVHVSLPVDASGEMPNTNFENVELQPTEAGDIGASQIYSGAGFKLEYVKDAAAQPGYLTIPSLGLDKLPMSCTTSWR